MRQAPELITGPWFNSEPLTLAALRGKVVVLHAFQMLCPGCVQFGLPQMVRMAEVFARDDVQLIGLHTVFEHHHAMTPEALQVFIRENRFPFPIAVDAPSPNHYIPQTMRAYDFQGTPSLALIDRHGRLRWQKFGHMADLAVGAAVGGVLAEP